MNAISLLHREPEQPEEQTLSGAASQREAEFRRMFDEAYVAIHTYARRRTQASVDADDVTAEVFLVAWRRFDQYDSTRSALPWLYGIASNTIRNQVRSTARRHRLSQKVQAQPAQRSAPDPSDDGEIVVALNQLSADDRELVLLVCWEGLSHAEAGQVLDCSSNAVGIRLHRARQRLQDLLDEPLNELDDTSQKRASQ